MGARRDLISDGVEMQLHGFTVAVRQHKGSAGSTLGTDCAEADDEADDNIEVDPDIPVSAD
jgi:hypothetical protein